MNTIKTEIKDWLKHYGRSRTWLGEQCGGVSLKAVNNWLSTERMIPSESLLKIVGLMVADETAAYEYSNRLRNQQISYDQDLSPSDIARMRREGADEEDGLEMWKTKLYELLKQEYPGVVNAQKLLNEIGVRGMFYFDEEAEVVEMSETPETDEAWMCSFDEETEVAKVAKIAPVNQAPSQLAPVSCLSLSVDLSEFGVWEKAALKRGLTLTAWAIESLRSASQESEV